MAVAGRPLLSFWPSAEPVRPIGCQVAGNPEAERSLATRGIRGFGTAVRSRKDADVAPLSHHDDEAVQPALGTGERQGGLDRQTGKIGRLGQVEAVG